MNSSKKLRRPSSRESFAPIGIAVWQSSATNEQNKENVCLGEFKSFLLG